MKQLYPLIVLSLLILTLNVKGTGSWSAVSGFTGDARKHASSFTIGNKVYFGAGQSVDGLGNAVFHKDFWSYDPGTGSWTQIADILGTGVSGAYAFEGNNQGHVIGGIVSDVTSQTFPGNFSLDHYVYSPTFNSWLTESGPHPMLYGASTFKINNNTYVVGGETFYGYSNQMYVFEPFYNVFNYSINPAPMGGLYYPNQASLFRTHAVAFALGSRAYVGTGYDMNGNAMNDFWEYNSGNNSWVQIADFPGAARGGAVGFNMTYQGYVGFGNDPATGTEFNDMWMFISNANHWSQETGMTTGRHNATVATLGDHAYMAFGEQVATLTNEVWDFTACPSPVAVGIYTWNEPPVFCQGETYTMAASIQTTAPPYTVYWYRNGVQVSGSTNYFTTTTAGTYYFIISNACGTDTSETIVLTVDPLPTVVVTPTGSAVVCSGSAVTLNANTTGQITSYQWQLNGIDISGANDPTYNATTAGTYSVRVESVCGTASDDIIVTEESLPVVSLIVLGSAETCDGHSVSLESTVTGTGTSYNWYKDGALLVAASGPGILTIASSGSYQFEVISTCGTVLSNAVQVTIYNGTPSTPSSISGPTTFCANETGVVYSCPAVPNATGYTWTVPPGAVVASGQGTNSITVDFGTKKGNVKVTAYNPCGSGRSKSLRVNKVNCRLAAPEQTIIEEHAITVYPNPVNGNEPVYIGLQGEFSGKYTLQIMSISGQTVYIYEGALSDEQNKITIDTPELKSGLYLIVLDVGNKRYIKKFFRD